MMRRTKEYLENKKKDVKMKQKITLKMTTKKKKCHKVALKGFEILLKGNVCGGHSRK